MHREWWIGYLDRRDVSRGHNHLYVRRDGHRSTGGSTVVNTATLTPTSPSLSTISSNPVTTAIGPNLALVKLQNVTGTVTTGSSITYTINASNESNVAATVAAVVTDPLPAGTSFVSCTNPSGTCANSGGTVTFNLGTLAASGTASMTADCHRRHESPRNASDQQHRADHRDQQTRPSLFSAAPSPHPCRLSETCCSRRPPARRRSTRPETSLAIATCFKNIGTTTLSGTASESLTTRPPSLAPSLALWPPAPRLPARLPTQFFAADVTNGSVTNTATATVGATTSNVATATVTKNSADLSISKTDNSATYTPGSNVTYTIGVTNAGPAANSGFTVTDVLPANTTFVTASSGCVNVSGTVTCTSSGLALNASTFWTITLLPSAGLTGSLANTATIATTSTPDPNSANNSATDTDTQSSTVDLGVTVTDSATTYTPGAPTTYTVVITNAGPSAANGATVSLPLPTGVTSGAWTAVTTGGATSGSSGTGAISDTVNVPVGGTITYTFIAQVSPTATGSLTANATVTPASGVTDTNLPNNAASDADTQSSSADLAITKTDGASSYVPGTNV